VCKSLPYGVSLGSFRGGLVFPALYVGAVGGMAMSHLLGLQMVAGVGMGMGAMSAVILTLPLTSVLLATVLLFSDGVTVTPLVIVSVVVGPGRLRRRSRVGSSIRPYRQPGGNAAGGSGTL
jgi:hypothetical protein